MSLLGRITVEIVENREQERFSLAGASAGGDHERGTIANGFRLRSGNGFVLVGIEFTIAGYCGRLVEHIAKFRAEPALAYQVIQRMWRRLAGKRALHPQVADETSLFRGTGPD